MNKTPESKPVGKVIPLRRVIINRTKLANDREWQGKWDKADSLYKEIEELKSQERKGVVLYPLF